MRLALIVLYVPEPALDTTARFYGAILDAEPVREQHGSGPVHWSISSRLTGLTVEVYPAGGRPVTATRLTFRGTEVRETVQRLVDVHALPEPHGSGGWWCSDPAGNTVVLLGSSSYDGLTEPRRSRRTRRSCTRRKESRSRRSDRRGERSGPRPQPDLTR